MPTQSHAQSTQHHSTAIQHGTAPTQHPTNNNPKPQFANTTSASHPTTTSGDTNTVPHHLQHVHQRQAIKSYLSEQPHRRASKKNHDQKYYRQQIKNYSNNKLVVNLTNHELEKPLKSILSRGLKFIPTPSNTHKQTIVNSFKRCRRSMYIHYHFRHFSKKHPNPFKTVHGHPLPQTTPIYFPTLPLLQHPFNTHSNTIHI